MSSSNPRWWDADKYPDPFKEVYGVANSTRQQQMARETRALTNLCYYGAEPLLGLSMRDYTRRGSGERSSINATKNCINSLHAEITQNRPKMMVVTDGGTMDLWKAAKGLDKLIEGQTTEDGQDDLSPRLCKDALIMGDGIQHVFDSHITNRVESDRILLWEVSVPEEEAYHGKPRTIHYVTQIDRGVLAETYDDMRDVIKDSAGAEADPFFSFDNSSDLVTVVESIRLPSIAEFGDPDDKDGYREATKDGRHVICTSKGTLFDEPWIRSKNGFFNLKWEIPLLGFWSSSFVDDLRGEQAFINRMDRFIRESMARAGLKILVDNQSGVLNSSIDDLIGTIIRGNFSNGGGAKPEFANYPTVHPEFFQHLAWRIEQLYGNNGVSMLSAKSELPQELSGSGKSIKAYEESKSRRFIDFAKRYETFHKDVAEYKLELIRDIYKRTGRYAVVHHGKRNIELVNWDKFKGLQPNQYRLRVFPTSALPSTPGGRIAMLEQWANAGWITSTDAKRLANFPDLDEYADLESASYDIIKQMCDAMLEDGEAQKPEPLMDLLLAMSMATNAYLLARVRGWYPERNMLLVTEFIALCSRELNPPPPPVDPNALPAGGALPPGAGGAPPELPPGPPPMPPGPPPMGAPPN